VTAGVSHLCIALRGELDLSQREGLDTVLRVGDDTSIVILDLSETTYLDSSALGAFLTLRQSLLDRDGSVALAGADPHVKRILEITGLDAVFKCYDSMDDARTTLGIDGRALDRREFYPRTD
jgi:anti-anti-sigma factor